MTGAQGVRSKTPQQSERSMGALRRAALAAGQSCVAGLAEEEPAPRMGTGLAARLRGKRAQAALCAGLAACAFVAAAAALA